MKVRLLPDNVIYQMIYTQELVICENDEASIVLSSKAENADEAIASVRISNAARLRKIKSAIRKLHTPEYN